nr:MAG TPA: hypothetical protein [Caudoviricetes sp.]
MIILFYNVIILVDESVYQLSNQSIRLHKLELSIL